MGAAASAKKKYGADYDDEAHPAEAFVNSQTKGRPDRAVGSRAPVREERKAPSPVDAVYVRPSARGGALTAFPGGVIDVAPGLDPEAQRAALTRVAAAGGMPASIPRELLASPATPLATWAPASQQATARGHAQASPGGATANGGPVAPAPAASAIAPRGTAALAALDRFAAASTAEAEQKAAEAAAVEAIRLAAASQAGHGKKTVTFDSSPSTMHPQTTPFYTWRDTGRTTASRFADVEVGVVERKAMAYWVRCGRQHLKARRAAERQVERQIAGPRRRKRARVDRLVALFSENEEQVQKMCMNDPRQVLATQIEVLTRRIQYYSDQTAEGEESTSATGSESFTSGLTRRRRDLEMNAVDTGEAHRGPDKVAVYVPPNGPNIVKPGEEYIWQDQFDQAARARREWKQNYGQAHRRAAADHRAQAQRRAQESQSDDESPAAGAPKAPPTGEALAAQLRAERAKLQALLPRFEATQRRLVQLEEQPALDLAEQFQEEQRAAMAARAEELREFRRKEQEAREQEERLRREQEEDERMRAEIYQQYQEEKRRLEAQILQEKEEERRVREEMEALKRRAWEDEQRRAQERERARAKEQRRLAEERERLREKRAAVMEGAFDVLNEGVDLSSASGVCECCGRLLESAGRAPTRCQTCTPKGGQPPAAPPEAAPPTDLTASGRDWMARALGALDDDDESDSDAERSAGDSEPAPAEAASTAAADVELLRVTEAIVDTIKTMHAQPQ